MKWLKFSGVGALALLATTVFAQAPKAADDEAAASLSGKYRIVSGEKYGKGDSGDELKQSKVTITATEFVTTDKADKRIYVATYTLDTSKKPWRIEMESLLPTVGAKANGLVSMEGDTVKLIYALPGGEMPTEFKTKDKQLMFVLEVDQKPAENKPRK